MIGKGSGHVKPDLIFTARMKKLLIAPVFLTFLYLKRNGSYLRIHWFFRATPVDRGEPASL